MNNIIEKSKLIQYKISEDECDLMISNLDNCMTKVNKSAKSKQFIIHVYNYFKISLDSYNKYCLSPDPEFVSKINSAMQYFTMYKPDRIPDTGCELIRDLQMQLNMYVSTVMMAIQSYYVHHMEYDKSKLNIFDLLDLGCNIYTSSAAYCCDPVYGDAESKPIITEIKTPTLNKVAGTAHLELSYPKQIFIESELYHDRINNPKNFDCAILNYLPKDIHYVINIINGNKADCGSLFMLRKDVDGITHLTYMNNRANVSYFAIYNDFNHIAPSIYCNKIGGKCTYSKNCLGFNSYKLCGFGGECDKFTSKICALIGIMTDYFSSKPNHIMSNNSNKQIVERDYKQSYLDYSNVSISTISGSLINHETVSHHHFCSSGKKPHIREGYFRHLKNGKKVWINSTIIHKDKYTGPMTGVLVNKDAVD